jgi:SAM-dependent methyltransferase
LEFQMTTGICSVDWTTVSSGWDAHRRHIETMKADLSAGLLTGLRLGTGAQVLELGAGTGEFSLLLAAAVGPTGRVIASDVAPGMVSLIRATTAAVAGIEAAEMDACDITLPDDSVTAIAFRMGLMLVDDRGVALSECRRVLAPGGRLGLAVWAAPQHNPWLTSVGMAAMMHGLVSGGPPTGPVGPFGLADPLALEELVRDAGFTEVTVAEVAAVAQFATTDEHFDTVGCLAPPLGAALAAASDESGRAVRKTAASLVSQYWTDAGLALPGRALLCLATR